MRDPKVDEILRRALPGQNVNENGRAPLLRHIAADEVLILEKFRAMDVGHGPGVDDGIQRLLAAETKREAQKLAAALVITGQALFDLVTNCETIGYVHAEGHRRDVPEGRGLTSEDRLALLPSMGPPDPKILAKVRDGYREQRHLTWHTFTSTTDAARWHCFFYEGRDVNGDPLTGEVQSEAIGPHVHYASHLFHAMSREAFVEKTKPGARVPHDTHVRFQTSFTAQNLKEAEEIFGDFEEGEAGEG